jgi:acyl-CoA thioester hydrolase
MSQNKLSADIETKIEFYDLDPMGIVWHGNYIKYFEMARCKLLDKLGYGYEKMKDSGYMFPVTTVNIKYIKPLYFGNVIKVKAVLKEYENCIQIKYEVRNLKTNELTTKGVSMQMAYNIKEQKSSLTCPQHFINNVEKLLECNQ